MKIPKRYFPLVHAFFLTAVMVLVVTGVSTVINVGLTPDFLARWAKSWIGAWIVAFPTVMIVGPWARRTAERVTA